MRYESKKRSFEVRFDLRSAILKYRLLGPIEAHHDGQTLDLGTYKQRALLALLLIHANAVVSTDRIIDELWGDDPGRDRQNTLWVNVSGLRSALEPDREKRTEGSILLTRSPGYVIAVDSDNVDTARFEQLAIEGRALLDVDPGRSIVGVERGTSTLARARPRGVHLRVVCSGRDRTPRGASTHHG